ncbi:MAG: hypothetical protein AAFN74_21840, partial [Myxococcota bacterium]
TVLPAGSPSIPDPFRNPGSATGTSRPQPNGGAVCHITGAPTAGGNVPSCRWLLTNGQWVSSGNCTAGGTATGGAAPAWCRRGKAGMPAGVRRALDADVQSKLAGACSCPVVNVNSACAGNCAPNAANPPTRVPTNGRDELELSFSRQANGSVVVSIIEKWTIHCAGQCN